MDVMMNPERMSLSDKDDTEEVARLMLELRSVCVRLEDLGGDILVLTTWQSTALGSYIGTSFVQTDLLKRFQTFCAKKRQKFGPRLNDNGQQRQTEGVTANIYDSADCFADECNPDFVNPDLVAGDMADTDENSIDFNTAESAEEGIDSKDAKGEIKADICRVTKSRQAPVAEYKDGDVKKTKRNNSSILHPKRPGKKSREKLNVLAQVVQKRSTRMRKGRNSKQIENGTVSEIISDSQSKVTNSADDGTLNADEMTSEKKIQVQGEWVSVISAKEAGIDNLNAKTKQLSCFKCQKRVTSVARLREHLTKIHKIKIGCLCLCEKFFPDKLALQKHVEASRYKATHFTCDMCGKFFEKEVHMKVHIKDMHEVETAETKDFGEYPCPKCGTVFQHVEHLKLHSKSFQSCDEVRQEDETATDLSDELIVYKEEVDGPDVSVKFKTLVEGQKKAPFSCIICKTSYERKSNFTRHLMTHLSSGFLSCNICAMKFRVKESLGKHMREHVKKPYKCNHCRARFSTETELDDHARMVCRGGDRENFRCDLCDHKSGSSAALIAHKNTHSGVKPFHCDECGKQLTTQSSLDRHRIIFHQDKSLFECDQCDKKFKVKDSLRKHQRIHEAPKYHCALCGKACTEYGNLKKHMMTHTKEKPFICEICGSAYGRKSLLESHRRIHTGEKPYRCTVQGCEKGFRSYGNLQQHIRTHTTDHPYVCDICGKMFKQPGRLSHHRKNHLVEFRWPCAYCPEKFRSVFMYKNHLAKTHPEKKSEIEENSNIRLYQCDKCQKMYGDKEDYTRHMYIHLGIKPFQCQYCDKTFNDKSNMKQHEKIHTGDRKFKCANCSKAFIHKKTLRLHSEKCNGLKAVHDGGQDGNQGQTGIQQHSGNPEICEPAEDTVNENNMVVGEMMDPGSQLIDPRSQLIDLKPQYMDSKSQLINPVSQHLDPKSQLMDPKSQLLDSKSQLQLISTQSLSAGSGPLQPGDPGQFHQQIHIIPRHDLHIPAAVPISAVNTVTVEPLIIVENYQ